MNKNERKRSSQMSEVHQPSNIVMNDSSSFFLRKGSSRSLMANRKGGHVAVVSKTQLKPLEKFAKKGKFDEIMSILQDQSDATVKEWLYQGSCESGASSSDVTIGEHSIDAVENCPSRRHFEHTTALHTIMKYHPPVMMVDLLFKKLQQLEGISIPEDFADSPNRMTPLHIAVAQGCDIEVVRRLMHGQTMNLPAVTIDGQGRTALHWACTNPRGSGIFATKKSIENAIKNVYILIRAYPHAKVIRDENSKTPMDLAIKNRADDRIISALHPTRVQIKRSLSGIYTCSVASGSGSCNIEFLPEEIGVNSSSDDVSSVGWISLVKGENQ